MIKIRRRSFAGLFPVFLMLCLAACGRTEAPAGSPVQTGPETETETASGEEETKQADVLVVYFSATGNTRKAAEMIAEITEADICEIVAAEPYTEADLDYHDSGSRTTIEQNDPDARPAIGSEDITLAGYDTVYLGYPIWHGQAPRIMSTFAEKYDLEGITVIPFCTSGGSGIGKSAETLARQAGSGTWLAGMRFSGNVSEEEIRSWISGME